ncbi:C2H2 conidiation transcription factor FlbC [Coccidioides immitis H538.4]|uniref:C2H2 conidiation transcription factor FlbC n=1 Tax=Coccidioides immitis H538.4 TaxID=396776 RepID=A0A0J8RND1_COCIT|nr:C2H2 conidiation transcription factor FlbC [Coccidioides immitis H538.4]
MVMESGSRQYGGLSYDSVYQNHSRANPPHFGEGWPPHSTSHPPSSVYQPAVAANPVSMKREDASRPPAIPVSYANGQVSAPAMVHGGNYNSVGYGGSELVVLTTELPRTTLRAVTALHDCTANGIFSHLQKISSPGIRASRCICTQQQKQEQHRHQPSQQQQSATTRPMQRNLEGARMASFTPANYSSLEYAQSLHMHQQQQQQQHQHQPPHHQHPPPPHHATHLEARSVHQGNETSPHATQPPQVTFSDALDASRGMVALSQDLTPRAIYGPRSSRGSVDSYGFPSTHSSASSISSANNYPYYSASVVSVDSSVTDYSSTTSDSYDGLSRTLPRPSGLLAGALPPQSMMGQFSSKVPSNTQKKHKCKVCDKRFTRPSSLQTHMYSHTGEKPYACEVEGCGRHFSVVSNLRRHKKVHKNDKESGSPEEEA